MKNSIIFTVLTFLLLMQQAFAQDRLPAREYTNPDELVVLSADVSFENALSILEDFSIEFKDKIFVNQGTYQGPIGIDIPQMHWEDALNKIAEYNNMYVTEYPKYFEIQDVPPEDSQATESEAEVEPPINVNFGSREIEISATFFQGDRNLIREFGIDWSTLQNGKVQISHSSTVEVSRDFFDVDVNWGEIFSTGSWDINSLFRAFEETGNGIILSSPTIKVLDGKEGQIQVGQDFSIKQRDFAGNITDRFFSTGTILHVTPHVLYGDDDQPFIYMEVETERSTAKPDPVSTIVNKQKAETEILMLSGESAVLAGLYETETKILRRGIPFLKDLPPWFLGLRYLFGYNSKEQTVQELVVLIKAKLVPTLEERLDQPFRERPELLDSTRKNTRKEILEMQKQQSLIEKN